MTLDQRFIGSVAAEPPGVRVQWGVRIPVRDGIHLNATLYLPERHSGRSPVLFTLTPYIAQIYHDQALYFASHGYPFLTIDVRGRGDSEGTFRPNLEAEDGHDIVEWLAGQAYCNGKVAMWGGSYMGHNQWATARELPAHLATIVPVASPFVGVDFPARGNISTPYLMQWLVFVSGRALHDRIFADQPFWTRIFRRCYQAGVPFKELDEAVGMPSATFQEWLEHPEQDEYWDRYNPSAEQYARMSLPILTITGSYDGNQLGALTHYREHLRHASAEAREKHFLIIGPWDHAGTRVPRAEFAGLTVGPASLLDLRQLHLQWYDWTLKEGAKPEFLRKRVAYYVMGAEQWRYADTLEDVTARSLALYLDSHANANDVMHSGSLTLEDPGAGEPDCYVYDPRDVSLAELESQVDQERWATDQRMTFAASGRQLVYHSDPCACDVEIAGFFSFSAWLAIDRPDTDFRVYIYEVALDGSAILLTSEHLRARYRESPKQAKLVRTDAPLKYEFKGFSFIARRIARGHRLRMIVGPLDSMHWQKNYNSGGVISEESMQDARPVTVRLYHDAAHPSVLHVPLGRPESGARISSDYEIFPPRSDRS